MLDNLNNVIERQALLSHHVTLLFAASITGVGPLVGLRKLGYGELGVCAL